MPDLPGVHIGGDLLLDHHLYDGVRRPALAPEIPTRMSSVSGGAAVVATLLKELAKQDAVAKEPANWSAELLHDDSRLTSALESFAVWRGQPLKPGDEKEFVWRLSDPLGYGPTPASIALARRSELDGVAAKVIVLDDAGRGFRKQTNRSAWPPLLTASRPDKSVAAPWIIVKMSAPLAQGDLWRTLRRDWCDRLIVVVSIDDIRKEEVHAAKAISWERAAADLAFELQCNPAVSDLLNCRHLVVSFGSEGALHVRRKEKGPSEFQLMYDAQFLEGESGNGLEGTAVGFQTCLTGAVARRYALLAAGATWDEERLALREGLRAGLSAMRRLREIGHGSVEHPAPGFPFAELGKVIRGDDPKVLLRFEVADVPVPDAASPAQDSTWAIITGTQDRAGAPRIPLYGLAARVARHGLEQFGGIPFLRFEKLFTVDRSEIESLRALQRLVVDYLRSQKEDKPLSIAVFGPPGAGKSFGVKQLAKAIYKREYRKDAPVLEFNLSQFAGSEELVGAFHAIRDKVLEGLTPVVFWDEFDSGEFQWLQRLLAPMQDGKFNEGQLTHPIGKCVFVFAGGTSNDFSCFGPLPADPPEKHDAFRLKKGPDFKSRLSGCLNVLGPNPRLILQPVAPAAGSAAGTSPKLEWRDDPADICFPIRRALLLRSALGLSDDERLDMDAGVLSALLELGHYRHGARSLEKIVLQMKSHRDGRVIRRSALPPRELVAMHANYDELRRIADRDLPFRKLGIEMAPKIHADWRSGKLKKLQALAKPGEKVNFQWNLDFQDLPDAMQDENVVAAARIPKNLALVGLRVVRHDDPSSADPDHIDKILLDHLEFLAEKEHDGWMEHKLRNGWRYGTLRSDDQLIHPDLVPYDKLSNEVREYDRDSVKKFPTTVQVGGFKIVPLVGPI